MQATVTLCPILSCSKFNSFAFDFHRALHEELGDVIPQELWLKDGMALLI
jgi:hypothetical protein